MSYSKTHGAIKSSLTQDILFGKFQQNFVPFFSKNFPKGSDLYDKFTVDMEVVSVDKKETFDEENEKLYYGFRP
jgi:hypothetical protein